LFLEDENTMNDVHSAPAAALRHVSAGRGWAWITEAFALVRKQLGMWILLALAYVVLDGVINAIPRIGPLAVGLFGQVLAGGVALAAHKAYHGEDVELADLFSGFRSHFGKLVLLGAGYMLLMLALGLLLLVLTLALGWAFGMTPAMIAQFRHGASPPLLFTLLLAFMGAGLAGLWMLAIWLAPALVVLSGVAPFQALRLSLVAALKSWQALLVCSVMLTLLLFLALLPLLLGLLVWLPVAALSAYMAWRDLFGVEEHAGLAQS